MLVSDEQLEQPQEPVEQQEQSERQELVELQELFELLEPAEYVGQEPAEFVERETVPALAGALKYCRLEVDVVLLKRWEFPIESLLSLDLHNNISCTLHPKWPPTLQVRQVEVVGRAWEEKRQS